MGFWNTSNKTVRTCLKLRDLWVCAPLEGSIVKIIVVLSQCEIPLFFSWDHQACGWRWTFLVPLCFVSSTSSLSLDGEILVMSHFLFVWFFFVRVSVLFWIIPRLSSCLLTMVLSIEPNAQGLCQQWHGDACEQWHGGACQQYREVFASLRPQVTCLAVETLCLPTCLIKPTDTLAMCSLFESCCSSYFSCHKISLLFATCHQCNHYHIGLPGLENQSCCYELLQKLFSAISCFVVLFGRFLNCSHWGHCQKCNGFPV